VSRVVLNNIVKRYDGSVAVSEMSLDIRDGEFVALLGPSGCGKTTTLRMIAGFIEATEGSIHFGDKDVTNLPANKRNTGMVFQGFALFPHMTVAQNVAYGLEMRRVPKPEIAERVAKVLDLVQLGAFAGRFPRQLSGGQQQRVAVARALGGQPSILLADEPTGNLDSRNGGAVMDLLKELHQEGATICMVTHDPRYAQYADRTIHLFDGRIVEENFAGAHA